MKVVLYPSQPVGWVAEVPSLPGCYALMSTRTEALSELDQVFAVIEAEYRDKGATMPTDTTEIVYASARAEEFRRIATQRGILRPHPKRSSLHFLNPKAST
jgi:predicted RNase H-like HicB family nuclease